MFDYAGNWVKAAAHIPRSCFYELDLLSDEFRKYDWSGQNLFFFPFVLVEQTRGSPVKAPLPQESKQLLRNLRFLVETCALPATIIVFDVTMRALTGKLGRVLNELKPDRKILQTSGECEAPAAVEEVTQVLQKYRLSGKWTKKYTKKHAEAQKCHWWRIQVVEITVVEKAVAAKKTPVEATQPKVGPRLYQ